MFRVNYYYEYKYCILYIDFINTIIIQVSGAFLTIFVGLRTVTFSGGQQTNQRTLVRSIALNADGIDIQYVRVCVQVFGLLSHTVHAYVFNNKTLTAQRQIKKKYL